MKMGISYWMFEGGLQASKAIPEAMREAKKQGFAAIELAIASDGVLTHETTRTQCEDIADAARKIGIEISSLASGESWTCSPSSNDPETRERIVDFTCRALQVAKWLGTDAYLFVPGAVDVQWMPEMPVIPYDVCHERAIQAVRRIIPAAQAAGVSLCIENVWNKYLLSPLEMRDFIDGFGSEAVGAYFDVGNVLLYGYPEHWIRILGSRIKRVHIKDFDRSIGTIEGFPDLLEGDVDFDAVREALDDIGYDGYVTAELLPFRPGRIEKTALALSRILSPEAAG